MKTTSTRSKRVKFSQIEIIELPYALGDNPSVSCGVPITASWEAQKRTTLNLDFFETYRPVRRNKRQLALSKDARKQLMTHCGYSAMEMNAADRRAKRIRRQRMETLHELRAKLRSLAEDNSPKYRKLRPSDYTFSNTESMTKLTKTGNTVLTSPISSSRKHQLREMNPLYMHSPHQPRETNPLYMHSPHPRKRYCTEHPILTPKRQHSPTAPFMSPNIFSYHGEENQQPEIDCMQWKSPQQCRGMMDSPFQMSQRKLSPKIDPSSTSPFTMICNTPNDTFIVPPRRLASPPPKFIYSANLSRAK